MGWRPSIPIRLEAIASRLEAIASKLEAIARRYRNTYSNLTTYYLVSPKSSRTLGTTTSKPKKLLKLRNDPLSGSSS